MRRYHPCTGVDKHNRPQTMHHWVSVPYPFSGIHPRKVCMYCHETKDRLSTTHAHGLPVNTWAPPPAGNHNGQPEILSGIQLGYYVLAPDTRTMLDDPEFKMDPPT